MRIAIVVVAAVLLWLLLRKQSKGSSLPSGDPEAGKYPLPAQPVDPGPYDQVQAYDTPGQVPMEQLSSAIATMEGYFQPGTLPYRTNNPGDIGTFGGNVVESPTPDAGWARLHGYVGKLAAKHPDWDFYDFFHYMLTGDPAGQGGPNQYPDSYAENVAGMVGADPTSTVSGFLGGSYAYGS